MVSQIPVVLWGYFKLLIYFVDGLQIRAIGLQVLRLCEAQHLKYRRASINANTSRSGEQDVFMSLYGQCANPYCDYEGKKAVTDYCVSSLRSCAIPCHRANFLGLSNLKCLIF